MIILDSYDWHLSVWHLASMERVIRLASARLASGIY